jgi:hypothetical protein
MPPHSPLGDMIDVFQTTSYAVDALVQRYSDVKTERDIVQHEFGLARDSLLRTATQLNSLLQTSENSYPGLDLQELLLQVDLLLEELGTPGKSKHFISIVALNELTLEMRRAFDLEAVRSPSIYLPALSNEMMSMHEAQQMASAVAGPLDRIFSECDFTKDTFDPNNSKFTILRELIFRLNSITGKFSQGHAQRAILTVIERLISLSSSFFSCLASVGFQALNK